MPLDEALSRVVIDFSGRPGLHMDVPFKTGMIGGFDTQLAYEFFQGFANHALVTLHIDNLHGDNAHHQCETVFKAFARALRMALDDRSAQRRRDPVDQGHALASAAAASDRRDAAMRTVAVVDYGMGNLRSVSQAVVHVAREPAAASRWSSPPTRTRCCRRAGRAAGPGRDARLHARAARVRPAGRRCSTPPRTSR